MKTDNVIEVKTLNPKRRVFMVAWFICIFPVFDMLNAMEVENDKATTFFLTLLIIGAVLSFFLMKRSSVARVLATIWVCLNALAKGALFFAILFRAQNPFFSFNLLFETVFYSFCVWALWCQSAGLYFDKQQRKPSFNDDF